jgi:hypothetical protein
MSPQSEDSQGEADRAPPVAVSVSSKCMQRWNQALSQYVYYELYKYIQFVNRDEDIQYGSELQDLVCEYLDIPETDRLRFWTNEGEKTTLEALRRKRQTISNAFRKRFESTYEFEKKEENDKI